MLQLLSAIDTPEATVYCDDENELLWYVLPKVPVLRRDSGKAVFKYVKYRSLKALPNGQNGAALVFMDVELALAAPQEQAVRTKVAETINNRRGANNPNPVEPGQIVLSKPQLTDGAVKVEILAASGNLVQKVNNAGKPSLYGNNVVAISAELNEFGAPVFEAVMKSQGAGGVRVEYEMHFAARLPDVTATGTWHASKFYSFLQEVDFEERFWSEDDFSEKITEVFTNSESRSVVVNPGAQANADPNVAKMLDTLRSSVERQLDEAVKRNLIEAIPPENRDFSKIREQDFENIRREVAVNKSSDVTINFRERQVVDVDVYPQANMQSLTSQGFNWSEYAMEVDLNDPFLRQLNLVIQVNADFANLPIFSVDVSIDYPPRAARDGIKTFSFRKADDIGHFDAFTDGQPKKFTYQYVVNYRGESRVFKSAWLEHEGDDLKINIDELGLWLVDVAVGDMNFEQVTRAMLSLQHPEVAPGVPPVSQFSIDKEHTAFKVQELLLEPVRPYGGSVKFFMKDGREYRKQLPELVGQRFYVDDPFSVTYKVKLRTRGDFERDIDQMFVDLIYDDPANQYRQTTSIALSKDKRFFDWEFPVVDELAGKVTYRAITTYRDGTSEDSGETPLTGTTLLLGPQVLSVKLIPDLIPWDEVKLARVELHYVDEANGIDERETFTFRQSTGEQTLELPIKDLTHKSYFWSATFFKNDNSRVEVPEAGPVTHEELILELPA